MFTDTVDKNIFFAFRKNLISRICSFFWGNTKILFCEHFWSDQIKQSENQ